MRQKLEFQADRIEAVLTLHKVLARVTGGTVTPRWVRFIVLPAVGAKISRIKGLSEELASALDVPDCRIARRGAAVHIEVPCADPQPVRFLPLWKQVQDDHRHPVPRVTALLGLAEDGSPFLIRLPSPDVGHILVAGTTGSGKTVLLRSMVLSLALGNQAWDESTTGDSLQLVLIDPKNFAFRAFAGLPHLARPPITDVGEATAALVGLAHLMEQRGIKATGEPTVVIAIDEFADILMASEQAQNAMTRLVQCGRDAGIYVVAATQKPTAAVLGPLVKANFPARLVGKVTSIEDARTAAGATGTGAERLIGQGDFLAVAEGQVVRFQAAHVTEKEIREAVTAVPGYAPPALVAPERAALPAGAVAITVADLDDCDGDGCGEDEELARRLVASGLWEKRRDGSGNYRWGFLTEACKMLFDGNDLAGAYHKRTKDIVALAERLDALEGPARGTGAGGATESGVAGADIDVVPTSTSTTTTKRPPAPRKYPQEGVFGGSSRNFEASRPFAARRLQPVAPRTRSNPVDADWARVPWLCGCCFLLGLLLAVPCLPWCPWW